MLGGDYPINATELSILERILEWLKQQKPQQQHSTDSKQTAEAAVTLLSRIDYGQLLADDMTSLQQRFSNLNFAQMLRDKISLCDISTQMRDKHGLLNLRGMQLCIVKVRIIRIYFYFLFFKYIPIRCTIKIFVVFSEFFLEAIFQSRYICIWTILKFIVFLYMP